MIRSRPGGLEFINNGADERQEHERQGTNGQGIVGGSGEKVAKVNVWTGH